MTHITKILELCWKDGLEVKFNHDMKPKEGFIQHGKIDLGKGVIYLASNDDMNITQMVLLHEYGHWLAMKKSRLNCIDYVTLTNNNVCEIEAYHHGWHIGKQLGISLSKSDWRNIHNTAISDYIDEFEMVSLYKARKQSLKRLTPDWFVMLMITMISTVVWLQIINWLSIIR